MRSRQGYEAYRRRDEVLGQQEKLEEYWAGHLSPTPFLLSIREEDSQSAQG
jgi:hypothetical protein